MKLNTYFASGAKAGFITLLMSASVFAADLTDEGKHVPVGNRHVEEGSETVTTKQARIFLKLAEGQDLSDETISEKEKQALLTRTTTESEESKTSEALKRISCGECDKDSDKVAKGARTTYYTSHSGAMHTPIGISYLGELVELEDESIWEVESCDRYKTLNWLTGDTLVIKRNTEWFKTHKYKIVNITTGAEVRVNLYRGPLYNGYFTYWIEAIDTINGNMLLQCGDLNASVWQLSTAESSCYQTWMYNDTIIMGVNDGWFMGTYPNLLINVNTNNDTIGDCI